MPPPAYLQQKSRSPCTILCFPPAAENAQGIFFMAPSTPCRPFPRHSIRGNRNAHALRTHAPILELREDAIEHPHRLGAHRQRKVQAGTTRVSSARPYVQACRPFHHRRRPGTEFAVLSTVCPSPGNIADPTLNLPPKYRVIVAGIGRLPRAKTGPRRRRRHLPDLNARQLFTLRVDDVHRASDAWVKTPATDSIRSCRHRGRWRRPSCATLRAVRSQAGRPHRRKAVDCPSRAPAPPYCVHAFLAVLTKLTRRQVVAQ